MHVCVTSYVILQFLAVTCGLLIFSGSPTNPRPYVPKSCCFLDSNGEISEANLRKCQTSTDGPPARRQGSQYAGTHNNALNYRVCMFLLFMIIYLYVQDK